MSRRFCDPISTLQELNFFGDEFRNPTSPTNTMNRMLYITFLMGCSSYHTLLAARMPSVKPFLISSQSEKSPPLNSGAICSFYDIACTRITLEENRHARTRPTDLKHKKRSDSSGGHEGRKVTSAFYQLCKKRDGQNRYSFQGDGPTPLPSCIEESSTPSSDKF
jgi:hypothetical protein